MCNYSQWLVNTTLRLLSVERWGSLWCRPQLFSCCYLLPHCTGDSTIYSNIPKETQFRYDNSQLGCVGEILTRQHKTYLLPYKADNKEEPQSQAQCVLFVRYIMCEDCISQLQIHFKFTFYVKISHVFVKMWKPCHSHGKACFLPSYNVKKDTSWWFCNMPLCIPEKQSCMRQEKV